MSASVRSTNLRFNLEKEPQRRAWEYLQTMEQRSADSRLARSVG